MDYDTATAYAWYDNEARPGELLPEVHERVFPHVQQLEEDQVSIHLQNQLNSRLYTNREPMAFAWNEDIATNFRPLNANLENVIQNVVDTLSSKLSTNRPKATIIPRGADFGVYLKCRRLDKFLWGEFVSHKVHSKMDRTEVDAMVYGTGFLKIDRDGDEVFVERTNPDEIIVDQRECASDEEPLTMHHRRLVSRLWLLRTYPEYKEEILEAQSKNFTYTSYRTPIDDQIVVIESWKRPTKKGAGDGRHTICLQNCTLLDEEYTKNRFPFVVVKYAPPDYGYYGRSLVADLMGYQIRLNELNEVIRYGQDMMCVPRILIEQGSAITAQQIDNYIGKILKYRGVKPEAITWEAFNAEIYNERDRIREGAFNFAGVSQMSAQSVFPTQFRMDSSEAVREVTSLEDQRFNRQVQAQEEAYKEVAERLLELNAEIFKNKKVDRSVVHRSQFLAEQIDWSEVNMERDKYVLEISTSSILTMTPAARRDTLNGWLNQQIITPEQYKAWSGSPDLERLSNEMGSAIDYAEYHVNELLKGNELIVPDPLMNLQEAFPVVHKTYMHIQTLEAPENVISVFVSWLEAAKEELDPEPTPEEMMAQQAGLAEPGMDPAMAGMDPAMGMDPMAAGGEMPMDPGAAPPEAMGGMV